MMSTFEWIVVVELAAIAVALWAQAHTPLPRVDTDEIVRAIMGVANSVDDLEDVAEEIRDLLKPA